MANTTFYKKAEGDAIKITWKDLFSESLKHHTKEDLEYALLAGTSTDGTTPENMLQKWRKPWLYLRFLGIGAILVVLMLVLNYVQKNYLLLEFAGFDRMTVIVISLVVPVALMIFFWEINIPRDITWYQLGLYFLLGAIFTMFVTAILFLVVPGTVERYGIEFSLASLAALREEPAKLAAGIIILAIFFRNKKIYGLTGLVVGAAVGAGFGGFESISYGLDYGVETGITRAFLAVGGHALFCAPYLAAIALHAQDGKLTLDSFRNKDFAVTFLCSLGGHFIWNSGADEYLVFLTYVNPGKFERIASSEQSLQNLFVRNTQLSLFKYILVIVLLWGSCIYILRKCLTQIVRVGTAQTASGTARLEFISGPLRGKAFSCSGVSAIHIGRDPGCDLVIPEVGGVSRKHCRLWCENGVWILQDLNSSYGTMVNGNRINTAIAYPLNRGDRVSLGGESVTFVIR